MVFFDFLSSAKRHNAFAKKKKRKKRKKKDIMPWSMHEIANVLSIGLRVPLMQLRIADSRL